MNNHVNILYLKRHPKAIAISMNKKAKSELSVKILKKKYHSVRWTWNIEQISLLMWSETQQRHWWAGSITTKAASVKDVSKRVKHSYFGFNRANMLV